MLPKALGSGYSDAIADVWDEILGHIITVMKEKMLEGIKLEQARKKLARNRSEAQPTDSSIMPNDDISNA